jgi:hypothetical protein
MPMILPNKSAERTASKSSREPPFTAPKASRRRAEDSTHNERVVSRSSAACGFKGDLF